MSDELLMPKMVESLRARCEQLAVEKEGLRKIIRDLAPYVLEDYYPNCATPGYKAAVEAMIECLREFNNQPGAAS